MVQQGEGEGNSGLGNVFVIFLHLLEPLAGPRLRVGVPDVPLSVRARVPQEGGGGGHHYSQEEEAKGRKRETKVERERQAGLSERPRGIFHREDKNLQKAGLSIISGDNSNTGASQGYSWAKF